MKRQIFSYLTATAIAVSAVFTSCDKDDDETKAKEFIVTFESNDGSDVASQTVKDGEKVTKPSPDPTRSGYTFDAWYKEASLTTEWKFDTDVVTTNITLYAKWNDDDKAGGFSMSGTLTGDYASYSKMSVTFENDYWNLEDEDESYEVTVPISDGNFTLTLPIPAEKYLINIEDYMSDEGDDIPMPAAKSAGKLAEEGIKISDKNAKICDASFILRKEGEHRISVVLCNWAASSELFVHYSYVDRDVNISASFIDEEWGEGTFDVKLKKGWNYIVDSGTKGSDGKWTYTVTANGTIPSGAKWQEP